MLGFCGSLRYRRDLSSGLSWDVVVTLFWEWSFRMPKVESLICSARCNGWVPQINMGYKDSFEKLGRFSQSVWISPPYNILYHKLWNHTKIYIIYINIMRNTVVVKLINRPFFSKSKWSWKIPDFGKNKNNWRTWEVFMSSTGNHNL